MERTGAGSVERATNSLSAYLRELRAQPIGGGPILPIEGRLASNRNESNPEERAPPARMSKGVISKSEPIEILRALPGRGKRRYGSDSGIETLARMNGWNQPLRVVLSAADSRCHSTCCALSLFKAGAIFSRKRCVLPLGDGESEARGSLVCLDVKSDAQQPVGWSAQVSRRNAL